MSPPTATGTSDPHDDIILGLVDRLMQLEFERGQLHAQLSFHLRVRAAHANGNSAPEPEKPTQPAPVAPSRKNRKRGQLEGEICNILVGNVTASCPELADTLNANVESVRATLRRLVSRHLLVRDGDRYRTCTKE